MKDNKEDEKHKNCCKAQSPINIALNNLYEDRKAKAPIFDYKKSKIEITNNGDTILFNVDGENSIKVNNKDYPLIQFHYHALGEHTIDDKQNMLELHFVHQYSETDYVVIGAVYKKGNENKFLQKYLDKIPTSKGSYAPNELIDLFDMLPRNKNYYNYQGSLTTPPYSESVNWFLLEEPLEATKHQLEQFAKILNNNFRSLQDLNGREIKFIREQEHSKA